jgi:hypothetical protein
MGKLLKHLSLVRVRDLLGLVHTNVCGPMSSVARGGFQYFITFTDDCNTLFFGEK